MNSQFCVDLLPARQTQYYARLMNMNESWLAHMNYLQGGTLSGNAKYAQIRYWFN